MATLDKSLATLGKSLATLDKSLATLDKSLATLGKSLATLGKALATLDKSLATLGKRCATLGKALATLDGARSRTAVKDLSRASSSCAGCVGRPSASWARACACKRVREYWWCWGGDESLHSNSFFMYEENLVSVLAPPTGRW